MKACDTCVHGEVCCHSESDGLCGGDGTRPFWRGDDAAVVEAARLVIDKFDACDDRRKIYFYSPFWHAVAILRAALAERGQR